MINWIVRIKNKSFWLAIIPAVLLLVQTAGISDSKLARTYSSPKED